MYVTCKLCTKVIQIGDNCRDGSLRPLNSICSSCFNDRKKTKTTIEVEFGDYDITSLTKLYYKNYVMYSTDECNVMDKVEVKLSNLDIILLKESPFYSDKSEKYRLSMILQDRDKSMLDDRNVQIFVTYGMHTHKNDESFFKYLDQHYPKKDKDQ